MSAQKPIKAFKHKHATRAAIPSHEEAGAAAAAGTAAGGVRGDRTDAERADTLARLENLTTGH